MSDEEPQQTQWETEVGLSEETTYVALYPSRKHAEEWMEEAEEQGYGSRSKYLYELIQEARAARQEGFLAYSQNESKVEELQLQVEQLQDELSRILNWAIEGYQRLHEQRGFTRTRSPEETRELWRTYGDSIDQFIGDWVVKAPDSEVKKSKMYDEYETYAKVQGQPVESKQQVMSRLSRLDGVTQGQVREGDSRPRVFRGIKLIGDSESNGG